MASKAEVGCSRRVISLLIQVACVSMAATLLFMGVRQVSEFQEFTKAIQAQGLVPTSAISIAALALIVSKIGTSVGLIWAEMAGVASGQRVARTSVSVILFLLAAYVTALAVVPPPTPVPCGCGLSTKPIEDWGSLAVRNWGLAAFALASTFAVQKE
jgi:hypothetical protein